MCGMAGKAGDRRAHHEGTKSTKGGMVGEAGDLRLLDEIIMTRAAAAPQNETEDEFEPG